MIWPSGSVHPLKVLAAFIIWERNSIQKSKKKFLKYFSSTAPYKDIKYGARLAQLYTVDCAVSDMKKIVFIFSRTISIFFKLFPWVRAQGPTLQEQNRCPKSSWESFAYVDEEEDEDREKVRQQFTFYCICSHIFFTPNS